jgi:RES domain-containing protein
VALDVDATYVAGEWVRHAPHRSSLLGRATVATDGRWQRATVVRALYLADGPATATAEWYRFLAERGLPPARAIPHDHHIWRIDAELADLSSAERLAAVGLPLPAIAAHLAAVSRRGRRPLARRLGRPPRAQRRATSIADRLHLRPRHLAADRL